MYAGTKRRAKSSRVRIRPVPAAAAIQVMAAREISTANSRSLASVISPPAVALPERSAALEGNACSARVNVWPPWRCLPGPVASVDTTSSEDHESVQNTDGPIP